MPWVGGRTGGYRRGRHGFAGQKRGVAVAVARQRESQRSPGRQVQARQRVRVGLQAGQRRPVLVGERLAEFGPHREQHRRRHQRSAVADGLLARGSGEARLGDRAARDPQCRLAAQFGWPFTDETAEDRVRGGRFDADLHAVVANWTRRSVVRLRELLRLIGDGRVDNNRNRLFASHAASGGLVGAVGQRVAEEPPQDHGAHHDDDGDQSHDHADADSSSPSLVAMTALPVAKLAAPAEKRWACRRWRARRLGLSWRKFRELVGGGKALLFADRILIAE